MHRRATLADRDGYPPSGKRQIYVMCDDVAATIQTLEWQKVQFDPVADLGWGLLTHLSLPGGGRLGLYQPTHQVAARKDGTKLLPSSDRRDEAARTHP
jgi:hypothetical protein